MIFKRFAWITPLFFIAMVDSGCSGGSGGSSASTGCVPLPAGSIAWTYEDCTSYDQGSVITIYPATSGKIQSGDSWTDEAIGSRSVAKGNVTWKYSKFDWSALPWPTDDHVLVFFKAQNDARVEASWHMQAIRMAANGSIITKLRSMRVDGVCIPEMTRDCQQLDEAMDAPVFSGNATYKFDCSWDSTAPSMTQGRGADIKDGKIECSIYEGATLVHTYTIPSGGPYVKLDTFMVGGRSSEKIARKPAVYSTLSDFRLTIFK